MADGLGGETENLIDQENPISPIQRQSSVSQTKETNVPSSRVGESGLDRLQQHCIIVLVLSG